MKGPSLPYELRVLRVFRCGACGRTVHLPGNSTSHLCYCIDPPKFMEPLERPVTKSPDVSAFVTPPDPSELIEPEPIEEEPYVPYIPKLPPRPPQFPSRRKLSDEIDKFVPPEFGDGVDNSTDVNREAAEQHRDDDSSRRGTADQSSSRREQSDRNPRGDRRDNRGRDQSNRRPDRGPRNDSGPRSESGPRPDPGPRSDSGSRGPRKPYDTRTTPPEVPASPATQSAVSQPEGSADGESLNANGPNGDRQERADRRPRNRRRRGRDQSGPAGDMTEIRPVSSGVDEQTSAEDDFGSGLDATAKTGSSPRPRSGPPATPEQTRRDPGNGLPANNLDDASLDSTDDDEPDNGDGESTSSDDPTAPRRRRNRRRGRRRGRGNAAGGGGEAEGATPGESA